MAAFWSIFGWIIDHQEAKNHGWVVLSNIFSMFTPTCGNDPMWLIFFKMGWFNHRRSDEENIIVFSGFLCLSLEKSRINDDIGADPETWNKRIIHGDTQNSEDIWRKHGFLEVMIKIDQTNIDSSWFFFMFEKLLSLGELVCQHLMLTPDFVWGDWPFDHQLHSFPGVHSWEQGFDQLGQQKLLGEFLAFWKWKISNVLIFSSLKAGTFLKASHLGGSS